jgi:hypothetical protein
VPNSGVIYTYTPHGYIDNPYHSWILNRSGVLHTSPPIGLGWHYPCARPAVYRSILRIGVQVGRTTLYGPEDFEDVEIGAGYHSKNILSLEFAVGGLDARAVYFLAAEHTLVCAVFLTNPGEKPVEATVLGANELWRRAGAEGRWEQGLTARYMPDAGTLLCRSFSEGVCFALRSDPRERAARLARGPSEAAAWAHSLPLEPDGPAWISNPRGEEVCGALAVPVTVEPGGYGPDLEDLPDEIQELVKGRGNGNGSGPLPAPEFPATGSVVAFFLGRGYTEEEAVRNASMPAPHARTIYMAKTVEDREFWEDCPQLEGDWPETWLRGWVYDWETLRMVLRPPVGIYKHHWDGMQIQQPRFVLAEAGLDALMMSYADHHLAKDALLGAFEDALAPSLPCSREDGSVNMVSEDGEECGTAPSWCYPFYCLRSVYCRDPDRAWLRRLFPRMEAYLNWWLDHRVDEDGYAFFDCSWESGQDNSARFLVPNTCGGGESSSFIRPVDLQAAMAMSADVMAFFAGEIGLGRERVGYWQEVKERFTRLTLDLWDEDGFYDVDTRVRRPIRTPTADITMLSPLMCGIPLTDDQVAAVLSHFGDLSRIQPAWSEWASFFFQMLESLAAGGRRQIAGEHTAANASRIYEYWDRYDWEEGENVPGVSCECWGIEGPAGADGYGWGATMPLAIIRHIVGFAAVIGDPRAFTLTPALPGSFLRERDSVYSIDPLGLGDRRFGITYYVEKPGQLRVFVGGLMPSEIRVEGPEGPIRHEISEDGSSFGARNLTGYVIRIT